MSPQVLPEWINYIIAVFTVGIAMYLFRSWINDVKSGQQKISDKLTTVLISLANDYTKIESFVNEKKATKESRQNIWTELKLLKEDNTEKINNLDKVISLGFQKLNIKLDEHIKNNG